MGSPVRNSRNLHPEKGTSPFTTCPSTRSQGRGWRVTHRGGVRSSLTRPWRILIACKVVPFPDRGAQGGLQQGRKPLGAPRASDSTPIHQSWRDPPGTWARPYHSQAAGSSCAPAPFSQSPLRCIGLSRSVRIGRGDGRGVGVARLERLRTTAAHVASRRGAGARSGSHSPWVWGNTPNVHCVSPA